MNKRQRKKYMRKYFLPRMHATVALAQLNAVMHQVLCPAPQNLGGIVVTPNTGNDIEGKESIITGEIYDRIKEQFNIDGDVKIVLGGINGQ